jgi:hypothetical protein
MRIPRAAGLIAAVDFLRDIETDVLNRAACENLTFRNLHELFKNDDYRSIYNNIIAPSGGFTELLHTETPQIFDNALQGRIERLKYIPQIIEYLLRCVQHKPNEAAICNISHAYFFIWWPSVNKNADSTTTRTLATWWTTVKNTAIFLYLISKNDLDWFFIRASADNFLDQLIERAADIESMKKLLESYAYVADQLSGLDLDIEIISLPENMPRAEIVLPRFSSDDEDVLADYKTHYMEMKN